MASNLVSFVMQILTPDMIGRIATALGLDSSKVQQAISAAVPGLLAGLAGVATQPGGAHKVAEAAQQQSGVLGNLANILTGEGQRPLADNGSQLLSSLLGGNSGALANAVGRFAGLGQGTSNSLLGMLTPIVLGSLAKQAGSDTSAKGIASLLESQKGSIAAALPSGFGDLLSGTGLLDSLSGTTQAATASASPAARSAAASASAATQRAAASQPASRNWLYWIIAALALAAVLYALYGRGPAQAPEPTQETETTPTTPTTPAQPETATTPAAPETTTTPPAPETTTTPPAPETAATPPAMPSLMVGDRDVGKEVTDGLSNLEATVTGITDAASAQAALPKLQEVQGKFDQLDGVLPQLSADQRKALGAMVAPMVPTLNGLFDKVLAIPGVSEVAKPTIDAIKAKLATLSA